MGLNEVIELLASSGMACYEVVQVVLSVMPIFVEDPPDNLLKREVISSGDQEGLQEASKTML